MLQKFDSIKQRLWDPSDTAFISNQSQNKQTGNIPYENPQVL